MDLISVIVPIYNQETKLDKCLDSICNQSYQNLEIILVNDGSTDSSLDICKKWKKKDSRIVLIDQKNGGLSNARNSGLKVATGKYISFIDSDDYIDNKFYENMIKAVGERTIALCKVVCVNNGNLEKDFSVKRPKYNKVEFFSDILLHLADISAWSKLYDRKVFDNVSFREGILNEDLLFMIDIVDKYDEIIYAEDAIYYYVINQSSVSRIFGKSIHDAIKNAQEVRQFVAKNYPELNDKAERFEIYQNLSFLWAIPKKYKRNSDSLCKQCYRFLRKNYFKGLKNKYLTKKEKFKLTLALVIPHLLPYLSKKK